MYFDPVYDEARKPIGSWHPGVQNIPGEDKVVYVDHISGKSTSAIQVEFEPEVPQSIMQAKPLYMMIQVIDPSHVRIGLKAQPDDDWYLSKVSDCSHLPGGKIGGFGNFAWGIVTGGEWAGKYSGAKMYQQILVDYVHYRYGLSAE